MSHASSLAKGISRTQKETTPYSGLRASERVDEGGGRTFLIEEIQSDMHQKVKQKPDMCSSTPKGTIRLNS